MKKFIVSCFEFMLAFAPLLLIVSIIGAALCVSSFHNKWIWGIVEKTEEERDLARKDACQYKRERDQADKKICWLEENHDNLGKEVERLKTSCSIEAGRRLDAEAKVSCRDRDLKYYDQAIDNIKDDLKGLDLLNKKLRQENDRLCQEVRTMRRDSEKNATYKGGYVDWEKVWPGWPFVSQAPKDAGKPNLGPSKQ